MVDSYFSFSNLATCAFALNFFIYIYLMLFIWTYICLLTFPQYVLYLTFCFSILLCYFL